MKKSTENTVSLLLLAGPPPPSPRISPSPPSMFFSLAFSPPRAQTDPAWEVRESGILAMGAMARGCLRGLAAHLPQIVPWLLTMLKDPKVCRAWGKEVEEETGELDGLVPLGCPCHTFLHDAPVPRPRYEYRGRRPMGRAPRTGFGRAPTQPVNLMLSVPTPFSPGLCPPGSRPPDHAVVHRALRDLDRRPATA